MQFSIFAYCSLLVGGLLHLSDRRSEQCGEAPTRERQTIRRELIYELAKRIAEKA
jgi:hypothetical protein